MSDALDKAIPNDTTFQKQALIRIQSFQQQHIDTFAFFSISYPGYISLKDSCRKGHHYPIEFYTIWRYQGHEYMEKVENNCSYYANEIDPGIIFNYYIANAGGISNTEIMPRISDAVIKGDRITYSMHYIDHEPNYALFYYLNNKYGSCKFTEDDVTNKNSQFYLDNINSSLYKWVELIKLTTKRVWQKWAPPAETPTVDKWINFNRLNKGGLDNSKMETKRNVTLQGDTLERRFVLNSFGEVIGEESWLHGQRNGLQISYYLNGIVEEITYYLNGCPWDVVSLADTTGKLCFPGTLHNGNGTRHFFDYIYDYGPVGFATYKNGHMEGPFLRCLGSETITGNVAYKKSAVRYRPAKKVSFATVDNEIVTVSLDSSEVRQVFFDVYQPDIKILAVVDDSIEVDAPEFKYIGFGLDSDPAVIPVGEWKKVNTKTGKTISTATFDDNGNLISIRRQN